MKNATVFQSGIDIAQELAAKNYEVVIDYANETQRKLISNWHGKDGSALEQLILMSRNILNFWADSIVRKRLWVALVRCGAWIGTLETIEKSVYEESMDLWLKKRLHKSISSIKHLTEILRLLEVRGVMNHGEIVEELQLKYASTLTEIIKKTANLGLIEVEKAGKYSLYSLTDAGVRYARQMRTGEDKDVLLKGIIREYGLRMDERRLDACLRSMDDKMVVAHGQDLKLKIDNERTQNMKVHGIFREMSFDKETKCLVLKTAKDKSCNYKMGV